MPERNADDDARQKLYNLRRSQREKQQTGSEDQHIRPDVFKLAGFCVVKCVGEKAEEYECDPPIGCGRKSQRRDRNHGAKSKQKWPDETDNAPRRFIFDDAVSHQRSPAINGEITQRYSLETKAE